MQVENPQGINIREMSRRQFIRGVVGTGLLGFAVNSQYQDVLERRRKWKEAEKEVNEQRTTSGQEAVKTAPQTTEVKNQHNSNKRAVAERYYKKRSRIAGVVRAGRDAVLGVTGGAILKIGWNAYRSTDEIPAQNEQQLESPRSTEISE